VKIGVRARFLRFNDVEQVETAQVVARPIAQSTGSGRAWKLNLLDDQQ
jgi:hypothetical protein